MPTALLTGSKDRMSRLGGRLHVPQGEVVVADTRAGIAALATRLPERSIGAYVQLLMDADPGGSWTPAVTERIEAVALVAPLLTPDATVLLVADGPGDPAHDDRVADGLRLLTEAALATTDRGDATVNVLRDASLAAITRVLDPNAAAGGMPGPLADLAADRPYADWRTDILSLTSSTDVTYFGWVSAEGHAKVGRLRGSVLSPLAVAAGPAVSWGTTDAGAHALAGALIEATLGAGATDDGLVELFVKDVIGTLPAAGFELSATEIDRWLRVHLDGEVGSH